MIVAFADDELEAAVQVFHVRGEHAALGFGLLAFIVGFDEGEDISARGDQAGDGARCSTEHRGATLVDHRFAERPGQHRRPSQR